MLTLCYILIGFAILLGIWYNGYRYSVAKYEAEVRGAEANQANRRADALERADAEADAERRAKDEYEATEAAATHDGLDFLRRSFRSPR